MKILITLCLLSLLLFPACTVDARTWYIKPDGTGDAPTIQAGIDSAAVGDRVIVACGAYSSSNEQMIGMSMKSGIYLASETGSPDCVTISGYGFGTVIFGQHLNQSTTIKGFTITGGNPICSVGWGSRGGGMYMTDSSPEIIGCQFVGNNAGPCYTTGDLGGGIYCKDSAPRFVDCAFIDNQAASAGGGMYCENSSPTFINCRFSENSAGSGGAICLEQSSLTLTNCTFSDNSASNGGAVCSHSGSSVISGSVFSGNSATSGGGGLHCDGPTTLINCTLSSNSAPDGGGIFYFWNRQSQLVLNNTIVAFSTQGAALYYIYFSWQPDGQCPITFFCSDLYGNAGGDWLGYCANQLGANGNFSRDPLFCNTASDDYTLMQCSPCAPGNHPNGWHCGLIGALPVGCIGTSITPTTWGRIKAMYR